MYYIDTIEQTKNEETGKLNEFGKREKCNSPLEQVQAKFYKKLSDVSADLITIDPSKNHYYMDIRITDTSGGVIQKDSIGKMQEVK